MKKTYIQPTIEVVKIHTTMMLAASPNSVGVSDTEMESEDVQYSRSGFFDFDEEY